MCRTVGSLYCTLETNRALYVNDTGTERFSDIKTQKSK